jgi:hypothetical protein
MTAAGVSVPADQGAPGPEGPWRIGFIGLADQDLLMAVAIAEAAPTFPSPTSGAAT